MKKIVAVFMILAGVASFGIAEDSKEKAPSVWDSIKNDFKDAGKSIKNSVKSVADDIKQDVKEETKEEAKKAAEKTGQAISNAAKEVANAVEKAVEENKPVSVKGVLKQGLFSKTSFTLKADDGNSYTLKTISGSDDSYTKLSAFKGKNISVTGVLDKKTNTITMTTYKSVGE